MRCFVPVKIRIAVQFEDRFWAMNTDIDVAIEATERPSAAFITVRLLFAQQEQRFSRFVESSLVSRLNRGEHIADPWLARLVRLALEAHEATAGLFNPMVLPALADAGYGTSFERVSGGVPRAQSVPDLHSAIALAGETVWLKQGRFDGGGIVKGWTVDLAVEHLLDSGIDGVLVNAGGDMRAEGTGDSPGGWLAAIDNPLLQGAFAWQGTLSGALATSTTLKRRWTTAAGVEAHHLIDPRNGLPAVSPYVQVSCRAPEARMAEVWAKAILIGGAPASDAARGEGVSALAMRADGTVEFFAVPWK
jgi:thiamine biosynthesis lipoprotein